MCANKGTLVVTDRKTRVKSFLKKEGINCSLYDLEVSVPERIAEIVRFEKGENTVLLATYSEVEKNDIRNVERVVCCFCEEVNERVLFGKIKLESRIIYKVLK